MNVYELAFLTFSCGMFAVVTFLLLFLIAFKPAAFHIFIKAGSIAFGIILLICVSLANYIRPTKDVWTLLSALVSMAIIGFMLPALIFLKDSVKYKVNRNNIHTVSKNSAIH